MGFIAEYFAAGSDDEAISVLDAGTLAQEHTNLDGIEPAVQMGTLEELLTGRSYDEITADPEWAQPLAAGDDGERLVFAMTDGLTDALAAAGEADLQRVAGPWSQTDEFSGAADPEDLVILLAPLAEVARTARANGQGLYCRLSM